MPKVAGKRNAARLKRSSDAQKQVYDNVFKRLIEGQFEEIVPLLFSQLNPVMLKELTIEALLPPRRMDRVYLVVTPHGKAILHIEIEMSPRGRNQLSRRILVYHSLLLEKYNGGREEIPVITLVLYPFDVPGGEPELVEMYEDELILHFHYREMSLRALDASTFMQSRPIPLYGLLPAMGGVNKNLLLEAIEDMVQYYEENTDLLRDELLCFLVLLNRAKPLSEEDMETVLRRIRMFDPLLEEDPWVQEYGGRRKAEGKTEGITEGKVEGIRQSVEMVVQTRFPDLLEVVMERVKLMHDPTVLQQILVAMSVAQDENRARRFLLALRNDC